MGPLINVHKAPPANLIVPHYVFAALAFLASAVLLAFSAPSLLGHFFQPKLLAITHLLVLGWGTMMIFGALYQIIPVISDVPLYNIKIGRICFWLMAGGVVLLAFSFWQFNFGWKLHLASGLILSSVSLFTYNIYKSAQKATEWRIETDLIVTSVFWLLLTVVFGFVLALNLTMAFLPGSHLTYLALHAHMGIIGWFILLIMGVASKLVPMFLLAHKLNNTSLKWAYYLVNIGLGVFIVFTFLWFNVWVIYFSIVLIVSGLISFGMFIHQAWQKRKRKTLDPGMLHTMVAFLLLLLPLMLAFVLPSPSAEVQKYFIRLSVIYGVNIIIGFITALILGQTLKTLPFIAWMHRHRLRKPQEEIPLPADMYSKTLGNIQFYVYILSLVLLTIGIAINHVMLVQLGGIALLCTAIIYTLNVAIIVSSFFKRRENAI